MCLQKDSLITIPQTWHGMFFEGEAYLLLRVFVENYLYGTLANKYAARRIKLPEPKKLICIIRLNKIALGTR